MNFFFRRLIVFTQQYLVKFISRVKFDCMERIKINMVAQLHVYAKRSFLGASANKKLPEISVLNVKGIILMKIKVSFIIHFCLGKNSFSLDTF